MPLRDWQSHVFKCYDGSLLSFEMAFVHYEIAHVEDTSTDSINILIWCIVVWIYLQIIQFIVCVINV